MATDMVLEETYDVVVVGSGCGGMVAALRAHDLGLSAIVVEKEQFYGGTSARSGGGTWIPLNDAIKDVDSVDKAMAYLRAATYGAARDECLRAYAENAHVMTSYLESLGVRSFAVPGYPDYLPDFPGAVNSRGMLPLNADGKMLGEEFFRMQDSTVFLKALNRYAIDFRMIGAFTRGPGWQMTALRMVLDYWLDIPWRLKTRLDRRLTMGRAMVGGLRKAMMDRNIPLALGLRLVDLDVRNDRVVGGVFERRGLPVTISARQAVILATGGFEQNQEMRSAHLPVPSNIDWSLTPINQNVGEGIAIGKKVGAQIECMDSAWWCPSMKLPDPETPSAVVTHQVFADRALPFSMCVDQHGRRFCNEAISYDRFGLALIDAHKKTGAASPCWMIFDKNYRKQYPCGGLLPSFLMPDWSLPRGTLNSFVFRANSIAELAKLINIDPKVLADSTEKMNTAARTGDDPEFGRGSTTYCHFMGDRRVKPNPALGAIEKPPFYAVLIYLGDLGTNGGIRIDEHGRAMRGDHNAIPGLYACGNTSGSVFGGYYPGAGGTLGPAMTFAYLAANDIAEQARRRNTPSAA